jgi:hypothetical protein
VPTLIEETTPARPRVSRAIHRSALVLVALIAPACGPSTSPSADAARTALATALDAWRDGKKPADLAGLTPPVQVIDSEWAGGRKLASYQIVRETPSETDKRFVVELTYAAPPAEAEVVYIMVGSEPVSVFRDEDYDRSMNMDNSPTPAKKRRR